MTPTEPDPRITLDVRDGVARLTIDNVDHANALSLDMIGQLDEHWAAVDASDDIRVAILAAAGNRHFCAGVERKNLSGRLPNIAPGLRHNRTAMTAGVSKPVITVVTGAAVGLGMNLALDADLVIATESAYFADPRLDYDLLPNAPIVFAREAPFGDMVRVGLVGQRLTARRAHEIGLVAELTSTSDEARTVADDYAGAIAKHDRETVAQSLRLMRLMRRDERFDAVMADLDVVTEWAENRRSEANERAAQRAGSPVMEGAASS